MKKISNGYEFLIDYLNKEESFTIATMLSLTDKSEEPKIFIRADGVNPILEASDGARPKSPSNLLIGTFAASITVAAILVVFAKVTISNKSPNDDQNTICSYILDQVDLSEEANKIRFSKKIMYYRSIADFLLSKAKNSAEGEKCKYILALKCLLFGKMMYQDSKNIVIESINKIESDSYNKDQIMEIVELSKNLDSPSSIRSAIDSFIENNKVSP